MLKEERPMKAQFIYKVMAFSSFGDDTFICAGSWLKCKMRVLWMRVLGYDMVQMTKELK